MLSSSPSPLSAPRPLPSQHSRAPMAGSHRFSCKSLIINGKIIAAMIRNAAREIEELFALAWKECPNCKYHIYNGDVPSQWPGLPVGVKFDPTDQELLGHLEGKVGRAASHVLIDDFIPTIKEVEGICYTHPENLPGIKMDGSSVHFFHRVSNAYVVGLRKRRKISKNNQTDSDDNMGWHKTGKSSPIIDNGIIKGWKKILVLHRSDKGKRHRTNWTMHQCHLGVENDEKNGDLVVSRVFWQVKNNTGKSQMHAADAESGSSAVKIDPTTPNMCPPQPRRLSGSPLETEQNQDEEVSGSSAVLRNADELAWVAGTSQGEVNIPEARHEKPPPDYLGMDALDGYGFADLECTFLATPPDFHTLINSQSDWVNRNVA